MLIKGQAPKFTQLAAAGRVLYALDADGRVWFLGLDADGWPDAREWEPAPAVAEMDTAA